MDKVSGDIRVCFEILRNTVTKKIDSLRPYLPKSGSASKSFNDSRVMCAVPTEPLKESQLKISYEDVHVVMLEMFESKIVKIVKKLPRSHLILLAKIYYHYLNESQ